MDKLGVKMLINDIENKDELFNVIVGELRCHGIKYRKEKRTKTGQDKGRCKRIFNVPLHTLELTDVIMANGGIAQVPLFVSDACQRILEQVNTEGLFRKAGSSKRQQEIKASLEAGHPLGKSHHVIDVANILKTFFRDLPEALLPPGNIQEALIRCLISGEHRVYDLMITCLLLPPITLNTLAFFMQFLHTVSLHAAGNKMTVENLAIILAPNLMPIVEMVQQRLNSHVKVIQLLIENSHQIGVIPEAILEKLNDSISLIRQTTGESAANTTDKKKKKRRSGSLTRMFHGLKKIVGAIGSSESLDKTDEFAEKDSSIAAAATPCLSKSSKKRKVTDGMPFSAKKKKDIVSSLPDSQEILPYTPLALMKETKKSRLSLGGNKNKSSKNGSRLVPSTSITSIVDNKPMERRWSVVGAPWARKKQKGNAKPASDSGSKTEEEDEVEEEKGLAGLSPVISLPNLATPELAKERELFEAQIMKMPLVKGKSLFNDDDDDDDDDDGDFNVDQQRGRADEYMRIPKSEYEAIKERVTAIETRISQEFGSIISGAAEDRRQTIDNIERVEDKYQLTLEQTEPMEACCSSTDQLAKRLSRELKIRRSVENKVMRSPSARKIGTIRRRSKENVRLSRNQSWHMGSSTATSTKSIPAVASDLSFYPKTNLKRGRPNTVQSGLKHPDLSPVKRDDNTSSLSGQNITDEEKQEKWTCAKSFFGGGNGQQKVPMDTTPAKSCEEVFKTPELSIPAPRRASIRSGGGSTKKATPHFVTRIEIGEVKTPMLPPEVPPRKTPAKTPMLPPKTPGRLDATLLKTHLTPLQELQSGRASIARLRSQNAGMVMAKAKLFDGMVTSTNPSAQSQMNRRQSNQFVMKRNPDGTKSLNPLMQVPEKIQLRQVHKIRSSSSTHNIKSPRRSTPRKRGLTKSPHGGGINRREKLRLAGKSPGTKAFNSPRLIRKLQDESRCHVPANCANSDLSVYFSPNLYDLDNKTPHGKKHYARNSPRRLINTTPQDRENRPKNLSGGRQQTPMKATPLSKLAVASSVATVKSPSMDGIAQTRRESPRLLANTGPSNRRPATTISLGRS